MSLHPAEAQRFVDDLQDAIEQVSSFWIPSDEIWRILGRMADEGHVEMPSPDREVGSPVDG